MSSDAGPKDAETPKVETKTPTEPQQGHQQWRGIDRQKLAVAAVAVVGVFLMVALIAILAIVLLSGSYRREDETIGEYMVRLFTGTKSICDNDPPTYDMLHSDWDGTTRARGTIVRYRCGYITNTPIARAMTCQETGQWTKTYEKLSKCKLDEKSQKRFMEEEKRLTTIGSAGCTSRDPPPAGPYFRDWNELRWKPGTVIKYYCSEDKGSPLVMTVECAKNLTWVTTLRNPESCKCPPIPPEYEEKKHLLNWEPSQLWIGTVIGYKCADYYGAPYEKLYTCGVNKRWQVTEVMKC